MVCYNKVKSNVVYCGKRKKIMLWDNKNNRGKREKKKSRQEEEKKRPATSQIEMEMIIKTMRSEKADNKLIAATLLSMGGYSKISISDAIGIHINTLYLWRHNPKFNELVDKLTVTSGLAVKSNRIAFAKGMIQKVLDERETKG